jgi:hypothetical protein
MGLDPTRPHRTTRWDYLFVAAALAAAAAVVAWALFG